MKNSVKKLLSILLAASMLLGVSVSVFAQDTISDDLDRYLEEFNNEYNVIRAEEQRRVDEIMNADNSDAWIGVVRENLPIDDDWSYYPTCSYCSSASVSVCAGEATLANQGYHSGFLGIGTTDCYMYYYVSRGAEMCPVCYRVLWRYDGQHGCLEVHKKCSKGRYKICPMTIH